MSILADKHLPELTDDAVFHRLCRDIWSRLLDDPSTFIYGRNGQSQGGIDVFGRRDGTRWVGIQCKVRRNGSLLTREIEPDILAARNSNPKLSEFVIATTTRRDTALQDLARTHTEINQHENLFSISTFFWDDVEEFLLREVNIDLLQLYFGEFLIEACPSHLAIARMFKLEVGVETAVTSFELMIGKTLASLPVEDTSFDLAYFKDRAFLVNLNTRKAAIFCVPLEHYSDLATAIDGRCDQYAVMSWLNTFRTIDALIRANVNSATHCISREEWAALLPDEESD